jgi:8-amino-7-oxononanoate synthase
VIELAIMRWRNELERLQRANRQRALVLPRGIDFTSNDYLGLAYHPALREVMIAVLERDGMVGSSGSRLLRGHHEEHARLEAFAADFFGSEKALYFGGGFIANLALLTTLAERHDAIVFDERIHASVKEGAHASAADRYRAHHNDLESYATELKRARERGARQIFIAVESVYSMDGDLAPLAELAALARRFEAILVVDEAHATGVFGARGRGLAEGLKGAITLHTCGKALGVFGALVCGPAEMIDYLINKARPFIYSTAPPPCLAAAIVRALQLVDEELWRRARVLDLARLAHAELNPHTPFAGSQIVPVIVGEDEAAVSLAQRAQEAGFDVRAIRPPTVPEGTARLRVSVNARHSEEQISALGAAVRAARAQ